MPCFRRPIRHQIKSRAPGLARAFFCAGTRSLLVSNWVVETASIVKLVTGTFAALAADPKLSHAEALQKSMLSMVQSPQQPEWVEPKFWAAFVVVGAPAKPQLCNPREADEGSEQPTRLRV
jgi:CHAT domain-containing protein